MADEPEQHSQTPDATETLDSLVFSKAEFARRHGVARELMAREGLDALLAYGHPASSSEVHYLTDFLVTREALLLFPLEGEPALFAQYFNHVPHARREARIYDVRWGGDNIAETVADEIARRGLAAGRLGIAGMIPWQRYEALRRTLPAATFTNATPAMQQLRLIKSAEELAHLRRGAWLSDRAVEALAREAHPGLSEHDLVAIIEGVYLGRGGQTHIHFLATTPMRHPARCVPAQQATSRVLERGDVLLTEISAQYHGYPGQILRPFTIGEPPTADYRRLYDVARATFERVAAAIRPGATAREVLDATDGIHAAGFSICDDLVHGLGGGYLPPIIRTRQTGATSNPEFVFAADMTLVIQPNIITPDERMGVQLGELVRVTPTGVESLHSYPMRFIQCG